ncbi:MAG TPA: ACT domain-containing protein [Nitrospinota bacterium]|jgi:glycine cleavage system transcriptional repressor|nr:ACT domain-containing protein [Anaerolineales bacterium]HJM83177.1 ACT domain-containing protein [Nitrospinota bacterium]
MIKWYMITLVGGDKPGIVAKVTTALYQAGCNLGETTMLRLGGNFTIMLMASFIGAEETLERVIEPVAEELQLRCHVDYIEGKLHDHVEPNVRITIFGSDKAGIVASVTSSLADAGLNISQLDSDVAGSEESPIYIMNIEGVAENGIDSLEQALESISAEGVEINIEPIDTFIG